MKQLAARTRFSPQPKRAGILSVPASNEQNWWSLLSIRAMKLSEKNFIDGYGRPLSSLALPFMRALIGDEPKATKV